MYSRIWRTCALAVACFVTTGALAGSFTWIGGNGLWTDAVMWGGTVPSVGADVFIDGGNATASVVDVNTTATIATLTIDANDTLQVIGSSRAITVNGGSIVNNGLLRLADTGGSVCDLRIGGVVNLTGSGTILFDTDDDNRIIACCNANVDTLVVGPDQLITTGPDTLFDNSLVNVLLENDGTIEANEGRIDIEAADKTNRGLFRAVNGGNLRFQQTTVLNALGELRAEADSLITYEGATVSGGLLTGAGAHDIGPSDATFQLTPDSITIASGARVQQLGSGNNLRLLGAGTLINNGELVISDNSSGLNDLQIANAVTILGDGVIRLEGPEDNRIIPIFNANTDILTIGPDQTITTDAATTFESVITTRLTNNGVIEANAGRLELAANPKTNNALLRARNGGQLHLLSMSLENAGGTITADAGSTVLYDGATIFGGLLTGAGVHRVTTLDLDLDGTTSPVTLDAGARLELTGGSNFFARLLGTITNNGTIVMNDLGAGVNDLRIAGPVTLNGTGVVRMEGDDDNRIIPIMSATTDILTIGPNQTITTSADTLFDNSVVTVRVTNQGVIEADAGQLDVETHPKVNQGTIRARNGGNLRLEAVSVDNAAGVIEAGAGSTITYQNATVAGGTIQGAGQHVIGVSDAIFNGAVTPVTIAPGTQIRIADGSGKVLRLLGSIIHDGEILIQDVGSGLNEIGIEGSVDLQGAGVIRLVGNDDNRIVATVNGATDILTIGANQLITTGADTKFDNSLINCRFVNHGIIEADGGQLDLETHSPKVNNSIIRAVNSGNVRIDGTTIDNAGGSVQAPAGSTVSFRTGTLIGGELRVGGTLALSGSNTLDGATVRPGDGIGVMAVSGNGAALTAATVHEFELGGFTAGTQHDVINVSGSLPLGGTLRGVAVNGLVPQIGDRFTIITATSFSQNFTGFQASFPDATLTVRFDRSAGTSGDLVVVRVGDLNCDGAISVSDIAPFVITLTNPGDYAAQFPDCEIFNADINGDGVITVSDIAPFVNLLTGG